MDEAAMLKALEGHFFWEKTSRYEPSPPRAAVEIRRAQRKFVPKNAKDTFQKEPPKKEWWVSKPVPLDFDERVKVLREAIAAEFDISVKDLDSRSTRRSLSLPKSLFMWSLCRYFDASIGQMARHIDRHHTSIMHGRDCFESQKKLHGELIAKMDAYMNHKEAKCG